MDGYSHLFSIMRAATEEGRQGAPVHIRIGRVLSANPIKVDVGGTTQEAGRFYISRRLLGGYRERVAILGTPSGTLSADVSGSGDMAENLTVSGNLTLSGGGVGQTSGALFVSGTGTWEGQENMTVQDGNLFIQSAVMTQDGPSLQAGDLVLLLTEDDQIFYLVDKVVHL